MFWKALSITAILGASLGSFAYFNHKPATLPASIYDFRMSNIDGHMVNLSKYKGKVLLIVNVASKCGNTPQYANLEALYAKYKKQGLVVMGFPENDFMGQEPGTNAQIKAFCEETYHVKFPMFSKVDVKGPHETTLYKWLIAHSDRPNDPIEWNFAKFLVNRDGKVVMRIMPTTKPDSPAVLAEIKTLLAEKR